MTDRAAPLVAATVEGVDLEVDEDPTVSKLISSTSFCSYLQAKVAPETRHTVEMIDPLAIDTTGEAKGTIAVLTGMTEEAIEVGIGTREPTVTGQIVEIETATRTRERNVTGVTEMAGKTVEAIGKEAIVNEGPTMTEKDETTAENRENVSIGTLIDCWTHTVSCFDLCSFYIRDCYLLQSFTICSAAKVHQVSVLACQEPMFAEERREN